MSASPTPRPLGGLRHEEVLEVQEGTRAEAVEPLVEERDPLDPAIDLGDEGLEAPRCRRSTQQALRLFVVGRGQLLETRELAVELDDSRAVLRPGAADRDRGHFALSGSGDVREVDEAEELQGLVPVHVGALPEHEPGGRHDDRNEGRRVRARTVGDGEGRKACELDLAASPGALDACGNGLRSSLEILSPAVVLHDEPELTGRRRALDPLEEAGDLGVDRPSRSRRCRAADPSAPRRSREAAGRPSRRDSGQAGLSGLARSAAASARPAAEKIPRINGTSAG